MTESTKICVNIEAIKQMRAALAHVNSFKLEDIEWIDDSGKEITVDADLISGFRFLGLNNVDFLDILEASPADQTAIKHLAKPAGDEA